MKLVHGTDDVAAVNQRAAAFLLVPQAVDKGEVVPFNDFDEVTEVDIHRIILKPVAAVSALLGLYQPLGVHNPQHVRQRIERCAETIADFAHGGKFTLGFGEHVLDGQQTVFHFAIYLEHDRTSVG